MTAKPNPTSKVSLDLDTLEREGAPEPYSIRHGGRVYTFADAMDIDWQKLMLSLQNPHQFFRLTLPEQDAKIFLADEMPTWKLRRLMDAYRTHHGMMEPGETDALPT
jgi:hypothetical protein